MAAVAGVEAAAGAGKRRRLSLSLSLPRRFMCDECTILHIAHDCANVTLCRRKKFRVSFEMKLLVVAESIKTKYQSVHIYTPAVWVSTPTGILTGASEREDENAYAEEENTSVVVPSETFVTYINKELLRYS